MDALREDFVGAVSIGQGAGQLQCADHQREDVECLDACRLRILRRESGGDVVDDGQQPVGVGLFDGTAAASELVEQGGGRAAIVGMVAVLSGEVFTHVLLDSGAAWGQGAEPLALFA